MIDIRNEMTGRERVTAAIEFKGPDRVPNKHSYLPAVILKYPEALKLLKKYPSDFEGEDGEYHPHEAYAKGIRTDEWGCVWTTLRDGILGQVTVHPLKDLRSLDTYDWPSADRTDISDDLSKAANRKDKYLFLGGLTLFERMIDLRGFENAMEDIAYAEKEFYTIRDSILRYNLDMIDRLSGLGADGINLADDWGSQRSLIISPSLWRELFLPVYKKMFDRVHERGAHVFFHTDGYTMDILEDLITAGADVFWVDMTINPIAELKERFGGKVCFQALPDTQFTMINGTPEDVSKHAQEMLRSLAVYNGGFIACTEMEPDQPLENMISITDAFIKYGDYPIL